jgi:hypothetical protein
VERVRTENRHLSDLLELPLRSRSDWSEVRGKLKRLDPGGVLTVICPKDRNVPDVRSILLTAGARIFPNGDWKMATRTEGRKIHCFLAPRS